MRVASLGSNRTNEAVLRGNRIFSIAATDAELLLLLGRNYPGFSGSIDPDARLKTIKSLRFTAK
jgi:hypothetical protein